MNILVLNCGSSTVKFQIINTSSELIKSDGERCLASGNLEKIGSQEALITMKATGKEPYKDVRPLADHREAINVVLKWIDSGESQIESVNSLADINAVGHRVLHGGERFVQSVIVDEEVMKGIDECAVWGPLHNPANLKGIQACRALLGEKVPQVAVFDTDFHHTMAPEAYMYGLPYECYEKHGIRRYGFHGTSHRYITHKFAEVMKKDVADVNIISLHLGNGCSACAIKNGKCVDTSMGLTPLEGLLMGTRCGDLDASILCFLAEKDNLNFQELNTLINKKSGVLGVSGISSDMRDLENAALKEGNKRAQLALDMFCMRVKKYVGAYLAEMNGTDAVVFTGGIGQNSNYVREKVCTGMEYMGIVLDKEKNDTLPRSTGGVISAVDSKLLVTVLPTNEELMIARDTLSLVEK